ncbi:hypothetical protein [Kitasatospora griseola]|uniref:hypothetical protein n=1 Tax=Kitasatospora griseola TaxID=2064 RepID=UPI003659E41D
MPAEAGQLKSRGTPLDAGVPATAGEPLSPAGGGETAALKSRGTPLEEGVPRQSTEAGQRAGAANGTKAGGGSGSGSGSDTSKAGQGFVVSPEQYKAAVSPVLAASEQIASLAASMTSYLPPMEAQIPWGKDESGKQFAEGEKGYLLYSQNTLKTLQSLSKEIADIAGGLKQMASNYEDAEGGTVAAFSGMDDGQGQPSAPGAPPTAPTGPVHVPMTPGMTRPNGRH